MIKESFCFFTALIFSTSFAVGMEGKGTSTTGPFYASLTGRTPGLVEKTTARNRALADRVSNEEGRKSSLEQRGAMLSSREYSGDKSTQRTENGEAHLNKEMRFQTPVRSLTEREQSVQSAPDPRREKRDIQASFCEAYKRNVRPRTDLDSQEIERLAWFSNTQETIPFSESKRELQPWTLQEEEEEKKKEEEIEDSQNIKTMRQSFMTTLEKCYGKDFIGELFGEEEKNQFLAKEESLSLEEARRLIHQADLEMRKGRDYLKTCESHGNSIKEALEAFNLAEEEVQQAQESYNSLNGSPWQHRLATAWYAIRTAAGVVSTGCVIVLAVTFHHGVPVVLGVSSFAVGYLIDPANLSRFVGCFFIPDNFNNMRTSWGKIGEVQRAAAHLEKKNTALQCRRKEAEKVICNFSSQHKASVENVSPALKKELEKSKKLKSWLEIQKKVEAFLERREDRE